MGLGFFFGISGGFLGVLWGVIWVCGGVFGGILECFRDSGVFMSHDHLYLFFTFHHYL